MKDNELVIRNANLCDINDILQIIRDTNSYILDKIVYGQEGAYSYIYNNIKLNTKDNLYKVVEYKKNIIAVLELKFFQDVIFINYISVKKYFQHKGIGTYILKNIKNEYLSHYKHISLDVFKDNLIAYNWYKKIGFDIKESFKWIEFYSINKDNYINENYTFNIDKNIVKDFNIIEFRLSDQIYKLLLIADKYIKISKQIISKELVEAVIKSYRGMSILCILDKNEDVDKFLSENIKFTELYNSYRMETSLHNIV